ncbi:MAG TPA: HD domain-containing phosphohydrolase [Candidatus Limnocylindrales bacterium]|jgi:putative two-component system response regulator|nr:HD domain-containing phosphohydrolase [Candidatus Limnocylindrales bacterium]
MDNAKAGWWPGNGAGGGALVLVVDDDPTQRQILGRILDQEGYVTVAAADGETALRAIVEHQPQLVLLDLNLPRLDGFEVCRQLRADPLTATLPVIVLTGHTSTDDMVAALDAGADDFLAKPFQQAELLARMRSAFRLRSAINSLERATQIVAALANAVEAKDRNLVHHCRWLARHAARVAVSVGLRGEELEAVAYGALLHDVGKIGVPEHLLRKEGPLSEAEWKLMRRHPVIGERICQPLNASRGFAPIIRHHHERFDGRGYPDGLRGDAIPLGARIVAIADAYEAIVHGRPYQPAKAHGVAADELTSLRGLQFDPELVPVFLDELERDTQGIPPPVELPAVAHAEPGLPPAAT